MMPKHFDACNRTFGKPESMSDEECAGIDAFVFENPDNGLVVTRTLWMPSKEDIEAINAGRGIVVDMLLSGGMCPIAIATIDENGQFN